MSLLRRRGLFANSGSVRRPSRGTLEQWQISQSESVDSKVSDSLTVVVDRRLLKGLLWASIVQLVFNLLAWSLVGVLMFKVAEFWSIDSRNIHVEIETMKRVMEFHYTAEKELTDDRRNGNTGEATSD